MDRIIPDDELDVIGSFDDEVDCAIIGDEDMVSSIVDAENKKPTAAPDFGEDDVIDVNVDYSNDLHTPDAVDIDADDYIAAERDLMFDPFGDEEMLDAATDGEEYVDGYDDTDE